MDLGISGKRAIVAGASSGLGLAAARALVAEGVQVVVGSRTAARIEAAAADLGPSAIPVVGDVGTPEGATAFAEAAVDALGGVVIVVTNAGGPPAGTFASTPLDAYPSALDLNLLSVVALCKATVPAMQAQGWGRVVAITSVAVKQPIDTLILSNTARAGATGFLKTLATEVAPDGVTVNSVLPGFHRTDRLVHLGRDLDAVAAGVPARTIGDPDDFGSVVAFLCSQQAGYVTGTALAVDGGAARGLL